MAGYIKAGILGGIVLFIWGFISWTMLPWHTMSMHNFKSDVAVTQAIQANAPESGIYVLPSMHPGEGMESKSTGPMVFASIHLPGMSSSMGMPMGIGLLTQIVAAFLVAWMLARTKLSYVGKVGFVVIFALTATIIRDVPAWNWFMFDTHYTLVMMADTIIGWFFAGLVLAKFSK